MYLLLVFHVFCYAVPTSLVITCWEKAFLLALLCLVLLLCFVNIQCFQDHVCFLIYVFLIFVFLNTSLFVIHSPDCGPLTTPGNGSVQLTVAGTTSYRATATQSCNIGFDLTGVANITCGADGNWSDPAITCTIKGN